MRPEEYNIPAEKFKLVNEDKKLHDKELVTKPVGYFKDAMIRFAKNKGSIVGAIVIGILVLYAIIAPIFSQYTVSYHDAYYIRTLPKLFNSETIDFLDGAENKTNNLVTFINHYAIGVETPRNAIKRQEYKYNPETQMYSYRLDSYNAVGTVFISSMPEADYLNLQNYQDRTGIQVIYPITDPAKRPQQSKNSTNANIWYETQLTGNNDIPVNYVINPDGSIILKDIYKRFEYSALNAPLKGTKAAIVLENKDGGYAIKVIGDTYDMVNNKAVATRRSLGYFKTFVSNDSNFVTYTDDVNEASVFTFNSTYKTFVTTINGHQDDSLDGKYFFAIPKEIGSSVLIRPQNDLSNDDYIPFSPYVGETLSDEVEINKEYNLSANRSKTTGNRYFAGNFIPLQGKFNVSNSINAASTGVFSVETVAGGYRLKNGTGKTSSYVNVEVGKGDKAVFVGGATADNTVWEYDDVKNTFKIYVSGHTDASLDGYYYFAVRLDTDDKGQTTSEIVLVDEAGLEDAKNNMLFIVDSSRNPVTSVEEGNKYYLHYTNLVVTNNFYSMDGSFKGDNYTSKVRYKEGVNTKYAYAIQKDGKTYEIRVDYYEYYRYYHKEVLKDKIRSPYFLFGTTSTGQDIFTCLASGARFSFILAITVAAVNFLVGTIYGAIEGYYGGKVDMVMERIVEILSAVPFMIVITLLKYHMKGTSQALILFISFFLTGWIGMSGTVRMQFYRFKNQEYVLASRTLGARDWRIMFKHIFPNSLGTIVTSSVLVIPGMIFSETSLSYLGIINLNSGNMTSVGTLLAAGQPYLVTYPHMILFPAIFISLLMLCFNLFGNGLRDAFNPSLRGTED